MAKQEVPGSAKLWAWSIGVRVWFIPADREVFVRLQLPAEVRPVTVRVLDLWEFPTGLWRECERELPAAAVARLHTLLASFPRLPAEERPGGQRARVLLAVEADAAHPSEIGIVRSNFVTDAAAAGPDLPPANAIIREFMGLCCEPEE